jgi:hypothetical protein
MTFADPDQELVTWGVATATAAGELTVLAYRCREAAQQAADQAPRLTISGPHPETGEYKTIHVSPLVYHHADHSWTFAAIGWPVAGVMITETPGRPTREDGKRCCSGEPHASEQGCETC